MDIDIDRLVDLESSLGHLRGGRGMNFAGAASPLQGGVKHEYNKNRAPAIYAKASSISS